MLVRNVLEAKGRRLIAIGPDATVKEALTLFVEHNIGSLPVVDARGQTDRDLHRTRRALRRLSGPETFHRQAMKEVMTPTPITCGPDDPVLEVMGKLSHHHVGQLPVLEGGKLMGLVSVGDLVKSLYDHAEAENQHLAAYLYGPG